MIYSQKRNLDVSAQYGTFIVGPLQPILFMLSPILLAQ